MVERGVAHGRNCSHRGSFLPHGLLALLWVLTTLALCLPNEAMAEEVAATKITVSMNISSTGSNTTARGVVFFKTHKTGGSTATGVLWRQLCVAEQRNCFLAEFDNPGKTWDFSKESDQKRAFKSMGTSGTGKPFDVWLNHAYYSRFVIDKLVVKPNTLLSIVRDPAMRFRSAWEWYEHSKRYGTTMEDYVDQISEDTYSAQLKKLYDSHKSRFHSFLDSNSVELTGVRTTNPRFPAAHAELIKKVFRGDIFLIVCDRFNESLLVLRRLMGWTSLSSIFYFAHKENVALKSQVMSDELRQKIIKLQKWDRELFQTANTVLDRHIQALGEGFQREKMEYESILQVLGSHCHHMILANESAFFNYKGENISCDALVRDNRESVQFRWQEGAGGPKTPGGAIVTKK